jgi:(1->4)-alpha-D-glucan 1-alpha-D-glucosylmutase
MTVPGVPDLYQGNEYWDFSLVDPDNRRPVDYAAGVATLDASTPRRAAGALARRPHQAGLDRPGAGLPPGHAELFRRGAYLP